MTEVIQCASCGRENPPDFEFCQYCQARLQPLTGALKGEDKPLTPGQVPVQKSTAELEPILPQWLKDARDSARSEEQDPSASIPQSAPPARQSKPSANDFLTGLQSQSGNDEEEEIPDWLANITGSTAKPKEPQAESDPSAGVRWVEMGGNDDFTSETDGGKTDVPSWLTGLQSTEPQKTDEDLPADQPSSQPESFPAFEPSASDDTPDWLKQMAADATPSADLQADVYEDAPELPLDTSDWLNALGGTQEMFSADLPVEEPSEVSQTSMDTPDWLKSLESAQAEETSSAEPVAFGESGTAESEPFDFSSIEIPDWMKSSTESETPLQDTTPPWLKEEAQGQELPAWLSGGETAQPPPETGVEPPPPVEVAAAIPDWLKAAMPDEPVFETEKHAAGESPVETPDWLGTPDMKEEEEPLSAALYEALTMPAPVEDTPPAPESLDNLFTEMPDWLSSAMEQPPSSTPTPITNEDALAPSELPSWVQAMRPVDSAAPQESASLSSDQSLEMRGALAGLQGVLPAVPGYTPTSKPKAYSIKLNASEEQQAHADILEQILAAETAPVPLESFQLLRHSRRLRWFIASALVLITLLAIFLQTRIFSMPILAPAETLDAISVMQAIPPNASILVAVDYEPARAGEMEASAAPLFDNLMLLKSPRLIFIATNQTGAMLAERFLSGPLIVHNYQNGVAYSNLGYLPGGQLGIRAFAKNPPAAVPLDMSFQPAWESAPLEGVTAFNEFTAMILLTDNADAARAWVEQTELHRGGMPFLVVSSAQAAPMIQPYYASGQVSGIISGLYGGAIFEQYNAGRPGTARAYWDAYSLGMLFAMALTLGGGAWNLILRMRERTAGGGKLT
jgi:hypothetical protein